MSAQRTTEELPSWNHTATRRAIVDFVGRVSQEGGPDYVPPAERIAVFDNDGTLAAMDVFDDGPMKPVRIWSRIGRQPILAGGNSNGDIPMLRYTGGSGRPGLRLLVLHDDGDREFSYTAGAEKSLDIAAAQGWTVISMKDDWSRVFADAP